MEYDKSGNMLIKIIRMEENMSVQKKSGYLLEDFRIFYNADHEMKTVPLHYHDFHKIVILLAGNASYMIEGRNYNLQPGDLVLVRAGAMHRPVLHDHSLYERIILYLSPRFYGSILERIREQDPAEEDAVISRTLFRKSNASELVRPDPSVSGQFTVLFDQLKQLSLETGKNSCFGSDVYRRLKTIELLLLLMRNIHETSLSDMRERSADPMAEHIMAFISNHLDDPDLCVDRIAQKAGLNRSYLMHYFKEQTGFTVGNYITEKRLFLARELISQGKSMTETCYECGFGSYSSFYRAYCAKYGIAPRRHSESGKETGMNDALASSE